MRASVNIKNIIYSVFFAGYKKGMGRPPHPTKLIRKVFDLSEEEWARLRAFRHALGIDTQREAIQRVMAAGLDALESGMSRKSHHNRVRPAKAKRVGRPSDSEA